jgi:hypothetical protein
MVLGTISTLALALKIPVINMLPTTSLTILKTPYILEELKEER